MIIYNDQFYTDGARTYILMQFVYIVGFDWLLFYVKFSIYQS
jgi:hypothetical protein